MLASLSSSRVYDTIVRFSHGISWVRFLQPYLRQYSLSCLACSMSHRSVVRYERRLWANLFWMSVCWRARDANPQSLVLLWLGQPGQPYARTRMLDGIPCEGIPTWVRQVRKRRSRIGRGEDKRVDLTYFLLAPGSCHLDDIVAALMQHSLMVPIASDALDGVMDWGGKPTLHGHWCVLGGRSQRPMRIFEGRKSLEVAGGKLWGIGLLFIDNNALLM